MRTHIGVVGVDVDLHPADRRALAGRIAQAFDPHPLLAFGAAKPLCQPEIGAHRFAGADLVLRAGGVLHQLLDRGDLMHIRIGRSRTDDRGSRSLSRRNQPFHAQMTQRFANRVAADVVLAAELGFRRQQRADRRPAALDVLPDGLHQLQIQRFARRCRSALPHVPMASSSRLRMSLRFDAGRPSRLDDNQPSSN